MAGGDQQPGSWKDLFERTNLIFNLVTGIFVLVGSFFVGDVIFILGLVIVVAVAGGLLYLYRKKMSRRQAIISALVTLGILALTILTRIAFTPPIIEISPINVDQKAVSLFGWQVFGGKDIVEINHHLIDNRDRTPFGEIPTNDIPEELQNVTIHLEIDPRHSGTRPYNNILLRVSGASGKFKDILLWDSFNSDSTGVDVDISLKDLVEISGIDEAAHKVLPNLPSNHKDIPEAELVLRVILEKNPRRPLSAARKILIRSEPWVQHTKIAYRGSQKFIDYAVKNFGVKGEFGYQARITKIVGPVADFDSPVWSGTGGIPQEIPDSQLFTLDRGEEFKTVIPLPANLPRGRYVAQIYTFKVPKNAEFNQEIDWENYGGAWMFATHDDSYLINDCDDQEKDCPDSVTLPIERMGAETFDYDGRAENSGGYAALHVITGPLEADQLDLADDRIVNTYILNYHIDPQKPGYAGFGFIFPEGTNVDSYRALRMKIRLSKEKGTLVLRAQSGGVRKDVVLGRGEYGESTSDEQTVEVPLSAFEGVDFTRLGYLLFVAGERDVSSADDQTFTVRQIEFVH